MGGSVANRVRGGWAVCIGIAFEAYLQRRVADPRPRIAAVARAFATDTYAGFDIADGFARQAPLRAWPARFGGGVRGRKDGPPSGFTSTEARSPSSPIRVSHPTTVTERHKIATREDT